VHRTVKPIPLGSATASALKEMVSKRQPHASKRLLKKSEKGIWSRRLTPMNMDKPILFNLRLSAFIGG
jgi:hypothetical protein